MYEEVLINALTGGATALVEYVSAHVLTCLIPAFFIAGAMNALLHMNFARKCGAQAALVVAPYYNRPS